MAVTQFATTDLSVVKLWSNRLYQDFITDTNLLSSMIKDGVVSRQDQTERSAGDTITLSFRNRLSAQGLIGDQMATGNEKSLSYFTELMSINELRQVVAVANKNTISSQRVLYNLQEDTYQVLLDWFRERAVVGALYQLAGFDPTTFTYDGVTFSGGAKLELQGLNTPVAPSSTRVFYPKTYTADEQVAGDSTATMKLDYILELEKLAETQRPYIRPLNNNGGIKYHLYLHTQQFIDLLNDTTSASQYRDLMVAQIASGRGEGEIKESFVFSNTRIFKSDKVAPGVNSSTSAVVSNCRRAVFCGKEALAFAMGQGFSDGKGQSTVGFRITSDFLDVNKIERIAVSSIFGMKKVQFNNIDHGVIVIPTYSAI